MRGRDGKGPQPTDLLVCFPSRAHLSLMPKPICSPARPSDSSTFHRRHRRRPSHHQLRKSSTRGGGGGHGSPLMWAAKTQHNNNNKNNNSDISEPTSPKVTCAGQIKVRTKPNSCKNWQSVMEEIERMHNSRKQKKRPAWIEALGFKKEVMQFLTCLRNIRFDFRCFGSIPAVDISSDDDEEEEEDDEEDLSHRRKSSGGGEASSGAVFSKWFMILQEENVNKEMIKAEGIGKNSFGEAVEEVAVPPANALMLMRCRSAPAKSWLEEREEEEERERYEREECEGEDEDGFEVKENGKSKEEEAKAAAPEFCEFAVEIAKENWMQERILRSRSWKR